MSNKNKHSRGSIDKQFDKKDEVKQQEVAVTTTLRDEVEFAIKMCEKSLMHDDFKSAVNGGTDDRSIAYSRIESAIVRLKIARDKLK